MRYCILILLVIGSTSKLLAQAGILDSTFGIDGKDTIVFNPNDWTYATSVAIQPDNRILVSGTDYRYLLTRLTYNGLIDSTFGKRTASLGGGATYIVLQPDGKVIQSGGSSLGIAMVPYNNDGTFDSSFAVNGLAIASFGNNNESGYKALIQPDGKILQTGYYDTTPDYPDFALVRWNSDGTLDNTFGNGGKVLTDFNNRQDVIWGIALQPDGKIVAAGVSSSMDFPIDAKFALARYNIDGSLDNTFGANGKVIPQDTMRSFINDICILPDGRILAAGGIFDLSFDGTHSKLLRFKANGQIDSSFGDNGQILGLNPKGVIPQELALQQDGKIVLAGGGDYDSFNNWFSFGVERYNADGSLDSSFGTSGLALVDLSYGNGNNLVNDMEIAPDGKIVLVGNTEYEPYEYCFAIVRFLSGLNVGIINLNSGNLPLLIYPNPIHCDATFQYTLTDDEQITISLFDMRGSKMKNFIINEERDKGNHLEELDFGKSLTSGNYILSISNGTHSQAIKIIVAK